ncbi:MAG: V-type ATP synthase subunit I [Candidatus Methanoperedens sp.]|jgi:V/A-type H+-transporting ATPase subunit I|nr:V-type ATP synthase subunit I [Candidatus Methanoperedens sp.]PKL53994.1 MAG: V-type ATP synthase subunit I [Candidatus Methanoperedenaceae archaeon HGW-Methanoperedenaceae-1]
MLKPTKMARVIITGTKEIMEPVISTLHRMDVLHITDYHEDAVDFKIGHPLKPASGLSEKLLSLRAISSQLGVAGKEGASKKSAKELPSIIDEKIKQLHEDVTSRVDELRNIEFRMKEKDDLIAAVKPFFGLELSLGAYRGYESVRVFTGFINAELESRVSKITNNYELFTGEYEKRRIFALFVPEAFAEEVQKLLQDERTFVELKVPALEGNPPVILEALNNEVSGLRQKHDSIHSELENIKKDYSEFILASDEYLSVETQKAEAPLRFATSANAFVIDGWIPAARFSELEKALEDSTGGRAYIMQPSDKVNMEEIPVKMNNPGLAEPFELLIDTFATPKYKEIDPSSIIFITFPLFYGIMLGDVGYGLLVSALALGIKSKFKTGGLNALALILFLSGIMSTLFGVLFGEFFGLPIFNVVVHGHLEHGILGIWAPAIGGIHMPIHRFDSVQPLLLLTFIIGIIHLTLGLVLGFRNVTIMHGLKHAIYEKGCWLLILFGGIAVIAKLMPALMSKTPVPTGNPIFAGGMLLAIIGVALLVKGEGPIAIMEVPTLLSNVLSYARILAIGLSSAGIALVVNTLSKDLFIMPDGVLLGGGIGAALVGVLILVIGHTINLILGIIGPGLHSLRLHYVEFFTKFYEGGGTKYIPFGYIRKYTEE